LARDHSPLRRVLHLRPRGGRRPDGERRGILEAYKIVAETEGVFCEPVSAAPIAGVIKLGAEGFFRAWQRLVCTLTGHGLKDPDNAIAQSVAPVTIPPVLGDVLKILGF